MGSSRRHCDTNGSHLCAQYIAPLRHTFHRKYAPSSGSTLDNPWYPASDQERLMRCSPTQAPTEIATQGNNSSSVDCSARRIDATSWKYQLESRDGVVKVGPCNPHKSLLLGNGTEFHKIYRQQRERVGMNGFNLVDQEEMRKRRLLLSLSGQPLPRGLIHVR